MKWPNDILVGGRKISGILCEMTPGGFVVAGIGVNLFHAENQLPIQESTSLAVEGVHVDDVHKFTHDLVQSLVKVWEAAENSDAKWSKFLSPSIGTLGERVKVVETQDHSWEGLAEGLNDDGHLLVRSFQDGILRTVVAADVLHLRQ
jgi:BirA family biotin operon repressor/biotin-[acetyl-CoA-carboxylase] ligase